MTGFTTRRRCALLAAAVAALMLPLPLSAQYFGRSKVQYETFPFFVLKTEHFQIYHYPEGAPAVRQAARMLGRWYGRFEELLGFGIRGRQRVILYGSAVDFQQTNAVPELIPQGVGGLTESLADRIVLPLTGVNRDDDHVLGHELVHAFQQQLTAGPAALSSPQQPLPLWLSEGMAEYLSRGGEDPLTDMWMRDAVLHGEIPSLLDLSRDPGRYFPYRFGASVWNYIAASYGRSMISMLLEAVARAGVAGGIKAALGVSREELSRRWQEWVRERYAPGLSGRAKPQAAGRRLSGIGSDVNLGPRISPDGDYLAVFAQRNPFTLDLYLAEAATGRVIRRLASSGTDSHFDSLRFIDSAGAWSPDSRSFAFAVTRGGDSAVAFVDSASGRITRVVALEGMDGLSTLAWSPEGRRLALSATRAAVRDLYLLDLDSGALQQLTFDRYTEIDPAWSPDGSTLAFATDRGSRTDLEALTFGSMNIALMDVASRHVRIVSLQEGVIHHSPQFSPDGAGLYFVAAPGGFSDIYRYDLAQGSFSQVTRLATGVSGLTELSPCLSVASRGGQLAFTVFSHRSYELRLLEEVEGLPAPAGPAPALPPPAAAAPLQVISLQPYHPVFQLVAVGQAGIGLTTGAFGPALGASADLLFEDVLGDHQIEVAAQINGPVETLGGLLDYTNRKRRINWGLSAAHIPQLNQFALAPADIPNPDADTAVVSQMIFNELARLTAELPFSSNRRLEVGAGYSRIAYQRTARVDYYQGGQPLSQGTIDLATPPALNLVHGTLAYVGDYSFFGFTSPVRGSRYHFEVEQTLGSLLYLTALADYRLYLFLPPVTLAVRAVHLGRYLKDAESTRLSQFYLGLPTLVRGYEYYSFSAAECGGAGSAAGCPAIQRLFGSRIAVLNAELRLPVLGNDQLGLIDFRYLPLSLAVFLDAGVAWTSAEPPVARLAASSTERIPVFSAGAAMRVNLMGAVVLELYYAYPFQRPGSPGSFGLLLGAGW